VVAIIKDGRLCVSAIARHETPYLLEWVAHQLTIGANRILIYDNGHDPDGTKLLYDLDRRGVVVRIPWTGKYPHGPQVPAYDDALDRLRGCFEWVLFVDLDEFLIPIIHESFIDFLDTMPGSDGIWFPWLIFGSSGELEYRPEPMSERFVHRQKIDPSTITYVKSAVRPDRTRDARIHVHHLLTDAYTDPTGNRHHLLNSFGERRSAQLARGYDLVRIHHYMTKSEQEWKQKVSRGRADRGFLDEIQGRHLAEFSVWDQNEELDESALRFAPEVREHLRRLYAIVSR
jgi:hypothetical protein